MSAGIDYSAELQAFEDGCYGAVLLNADLTILAVSDGTLALAGYEGENLVGRSALEVVHPDDLDRAGEALGEAMAAAGTNAEGMYRLRFADETYHDFGVRATCLGEARSNETVFQFGPVPEQLRAGEFARDTVDTLRMLAESHKIDAYLERVHRLTERHIQGARLFVTTYDAENVLRTHCRADDGVSFTSTPAEPDLPTHVQQALEDHLRGPWRSFHRMALFEPFPDGGRITSVLTDDHDKVLGYAEVLVPTDVEPDDHSWMVHGLVRQVLTIVLQRVQLDEQLRHAADLDPLTGLANRRRLFSDMDAVGDLAGSSVMLIDLDRFSWINNTLGHHVGDQALVDFAQALRVACPAGSTIARFGGDEFVIWVSAGVDDPYALADDIRAQQRLHQVGDDERTVVRCSIGSVSVRAGETPTGAIKRADEAMYIAKRRGGDCIHSA